MEAIETRYRGYRMRSRLEARWAVFFDALNLRWEYEPEGYVLKGGIHYLPDFLLMDFGVLVEIKPRIYDINLDPKINAYWNMCEQNDSMRGLWVIHGTPGMPTNGHHDEWPYVCHTPDYPYLWCICPQCGALGMQYEGRAARNKHLPNCPRPVEGPSWRGYSENIAIEKAMDEARAARFEHGEMPQIHVEPKYPLIGKADEEFLRLCDRARYADRNEFNRLPKSKPTKQS